MLVKFIGDPTEREGSTGWSRQRVSLFGKDFVLGGEPVDCLDLDDRSKQKLRAHNHFEVVAPPEPAAVVEESNPADADTPKPKGKSKPADAE